jgi:hypothetical protein
MTASDCSSIKNIFPFPAKIPATVLADPVYTCRDGKRRNPYSRTCSSEMSETLPTLFLNYKIFRCSSYLYYSKPLS